MNDFPSTMMNAHKMCVLVLCSNAFVNDRSSDGVFSVRFSSFRIVRSTRSSHREQMDKMPDVRFIVSFVSAKPSDNRPRSPLSVRNNWVLVYRRAVGAIVFLSLRPKPERRRTHSWITDQNGNTDVLETNSRKPI